METTQENNEEVPEVIKGSIIDPKEEDVIDKIYKIIKSEEGVRTLEYFSEKLAIFTREIEKDFIIITKIDQLAKYCDSSFYYVRNPKLLGSVLVNIISRGEQ